MTSPVENGAGSLIIAIPCTVSARYLAPLRILFGVQVLDEKETTVYKRALEVAYQLKMQASRTVFSLINSSFATMPFTLRALLDEAANQKTELKVGQLKLGLVECLNHGLLHPYPVLHEKAGEVVAQIKGTVLLMPNGSSIVTSAPRQLVTTEKKVEDKEILDLLATPVSAKSAKKKKNKVSLQWGWLRGVSRNATCGERLARSVFE